MDRVLLDNGLVSSRPNSSANDTTTLPGAAWLGAAHLVVDAVAVASVLRASPANDAAIPSALAFVLGYDLLAFAGQAPFGWLVDKLDLRRGAAFIGLALCATALVAGRDAGLAVVILAGLGNAFFHVGAGAMVLAGSNGRSAPAGVFVAPGVLGLGLGMILGRKLLTVPLGPWLFAIAGAAVVVWLVPTRKQSVAARTTPLPAHHHAEGLAIIALLSLSVAIRSLVGTVGCDACQRSFFLMAAVPVAAFAGKFVGGFLADRFGWINLGTTALLASAPLLAFSRGDPWLALPGLIVFQMTMPVTLAAMMRLMPARPGLGFGIASLALVAGTLPAYLPGGWRPRGLPVLVLVLGSAAMLFLALRLLLARSQPQAVPAAMPQTAPSILCGGQL